MATPTKLTPRSRVLPLQRDTHGSTLKKVALIASAFFGVAVVTHLVIRRA